MENQADGSTFLIRTMNVIGLKNDIEDIRDKKPKELKACGSYVHIYLLFFSHLHVEMLNFTVIPCIFELTYHLEGESPLNAALVLAVTPLSTFVYSLLLNKWTESILIYYTPMLVQ